MTAYVLTIPGQPIDPEAPVLNLTPELAERIAEDAGTTAAEVMRQAQVMTQTGFLTKVDPAPVPAAWVDWAAAETGMTEAEARASVDRLWMTGRIQIAGRRYG
jgi:hypothetical protein